MFQPEYEHRLLRGVTGGKKEQLDLRCIPTRAGNMELGDLFIYFVSRFLIS